MSTAVQPLAELDLLTIADAARVLGVSRQAVHQALSEGRAPEPAVRLRRGVLWKRDEIEAWATKRGRGAADEG